MSKKSALGKGIASLIQVNSTPGMPLSLSNLLEAEQTVTETPQKSSELRTDKSSEKPNDEMGPVMIEISAIRMNRYQPRQMFQEKELQELAESIKMNGVIQPILVSKHGQEFELIAGERRLRASQMANLDKIPAVVKKVTDREKLVMAIIENVQRADLNCIEEAMAYQNLMDDFHLTQEEVSKRIGKERSSIANFLRILKLPKEVIQWMRENKLSFGHAKVLVSLKDENKIVELAYQTIEQSLSVRDLEEILKKNSRANTKNKENEKENDDRFDYIRQSLEKRTGMHFSLSTKKDGSGAIAIKFSNEAELNDIYEYLVRK